MRLVELVVATLVLLGAPRVALAQEAAAAPGGAGGGAAPPATGARERVETDASGGGSAPGVVLMVVGGVAVAAGATVLVIDAIGEPEERREAGLDLGLAGVRGRAGQLPEDDSRAAPWIGLGLIGGGALVHLLGVVLVFSADEDDDAPPRAPAAQLQPVIGPGFGALRGTF